MNYYENEKSAAVILWIVVALIGLDSEQRIYAVDMNEEPVALVQYATSFEILLFEGKG